MRSPLGFASLRARAFRRLLAGLCAGLRGERGRRPLAGSSRVHWTPLAFGSLRAPPFRAALAGAGGVVRGVDDVLERGRLRPLDERLVERELPLGGHAVDDLEVERARRPGPVVVVPGMVGIGGSGRQRQRNEEGGGAGGALGRHELSSPWGRDWPLRGGGVQSQFLVRPRLEHDARQVRPDR